MSAFFILTETHTLNVHAHTWQDACGGSPEVIFYIYSFSSERDSKYLVELLQ